MGEGIIGKIGLVGFDGNPVFDFFDAPISYIQQPIDVLVQKALEILIDIIINGNTVQSVLAEENLLKWLLRELFLHDSLIDLVNFYINLNKIS